MPDRPSLAASIRFSVTGLIESLHAFLTWNLVAVVGVAVIAFSLVITNVALLAVPFLAPIVCGILRLAALSWRGDHVALRSAVPGIRHRFWTKVGLAAAQCVLLVLALLNLLIAPSIGGLFAALSMATSVYLAATVVAFATVGWTLLCDPRRESEPVGHLARLAMIVLLRRPLAVIFLVVVVALSTVVVYNLVVPSLFLPSMVLLLVAGYVLPAADEIVPVAEA